MKIFVDNEGNYFEPNEVVFCDIDTPGPQFLGYVTKESFDSTNCIDDWKEVSIIEDKILEYETIHGMDIIKGVHRYKTT